MKKFSFCIAAILTAMTMQAQDVVLPANVKPLLPEGVKLSTAFLNENIKSRILEEQPIVKCGTTLYFAATDADHGTELWKYDALKGEASMVVDINPGTGSSNPKWMTKTDDKRIFFQADNGTNGAELWVTDGVNTTMVMDIYADKTGSEPQGITALGNKVLFFAMDEESEWSPVISGAEGEKWLWVSDGTAAGTKRIGDTPTKLDNAGTEGLIVVVNGKGIFAGYDAVNNQTIWATDGTAAGTAPLMNVNPRESTDGVYETESAGIEHLVAIDGRIAAFRATTVTEVVGGDIDWGKEIWMTDGTPEGTKQIGFPINKLEKDGEYSSCDFRQTYPIKNHLYFRANNGNKAVNGAEAYVWDIDQDIKEGVNPRMIQDCAHNKGVMYYNSHTSCFYEYKNYLYLAGNYTYEIAEGDSTKMWDSGYHTLLRGLLTDVWDPNSQELKPIQGEYEWTGFEIFPGGQPFTHKFATANDTLFFTCRDQSEPDNYELWKLDSRTPGSAVFDKPVKVMDLPGDGQISYTMQVRQELYFASVTQQQLYVYQMANIIVPFDDDEEPSALHNAKESLRCVRKVVDNGMIYILRDNQKVSILGTTIQ